MALKLLVGLVLTPLAAAVPDGVPDMDGKCHSLLVAMSASPHSTTELSMVCRAKMPMSLCHAAVRELGEKPWSRAKVDRACARWEDQWTARELKMTPAERKLDAMDFQAQIDDIMAKKAAVGLCKDQSVNECAAYKKEEYPKYQSELNDVYKQKRGGASDAIEETASKTSDAVGDASEGASDAIDEISSKASDAVEDVSDGTSDAIDEISSKASDAVDDVSSSAGGSGATSKVSDALDDRRARQKERVLRKLEDTVDGKSEKATEAADDATDEVDDASSAVTDAVEDATEDASSAVTDAAGGDSSEASEAAEDASSAVADASSAVAQKYQMLGKISPVSKSKVSDALDDRRARQKERGLRKLEDTVNGKSEKATEAADDATDEVDDASSAVNDAVEDATEDASSAVADAAGGGSSEASEAAEDASSAVADAAQKYQMLGKISPVSWSPFTLAAAGAAALSIAGAALILARRRKARGMVTVPRAVPELQSIE